MSTGYINEDGKFVDFDELETAAKCDACGEIVEEKVGDLETPNTEHINAESLGLEDYTGFGDVCPTCLVEGIGQEGIERMKEHVFDQDDELGPF